MADRTINIQKDDSNDNLDPQQQQLEEQQQQPQLVPPEQQQQQDQEPIIYNTVLVFKPMQPPPELHKLQQRQQQTILRLYNLQILRMKQWIEAMTLYKMLKVTQTFDAFNTIIERTRVIIHYQMNTQKPHEIKVLKKLSKQVSKQQRHDEKKLLAEQYRLHVDRRKRDYALRDLIMDMIIKLLEDKIITQIKKERTQQSDSCLDNDRGHSSSATTNLSQISHYSTGQSSSTVSSPSLPCRYCQRIFTTTRARTNHETLDHPDVQTYICVVCEKHFRSPHELTNHHKVHDNEKSVTCNKCNRKFRCVSHLETHKKKAHKNE